MAEEVWERANQTRADGWGEWVGRVGSLVDVWGDGVLGSFLRVV